MQDSRGRTSQRVTIPLVSLVVAFSVLLAMLLKAPELSTVIISELSKLLQSPAVRSNLDTFLALRYHESLALESLSQKLLSSGEGLTINIDLRSLSLGPKMRYLLVTGLVDISVIVPTLNEEKYLPRCLRSLNNQTGSVSSEIIVVDGGSTDRTVEVARQDADKVLLRPHHHVGAARNIGARHASGPIVAFIDADTYIAQNWLTAIANVFEDKSVVGVTGPTLPYEGDVADMITYRLWTIYLQRILLLAGMPHVIGFNCSYRKDLFLQVGGFDETWVMSEDIRLAQKMRRRGRIVFEKDMFALTSPRRFQKYGHAYIAGLYLLNGFSTLLVNTSSKTYPPVR